MKQSLWLKQTLRRWYWAYGGDSNELFIGKLFHLAAPSMLISTVNYGNELRQNFKGRRIEYTFYVPMSDLTLQSERVKNYWSLDRLRFHIYLILLTWPQQITIRFVIFLIIWTRKNSTTRTISKRIFPTSSTKSLKTSTKTRSFLYESVGDRS